MKKVLAFVEFYAEEIVSIFLVIAGLMALAWAINPDNIEREIARLDAAAEQSAVQVEYEKGNFYDLQDEPIRFWQQCWNLNDSSKEELV